MTQTTYLPNGLKFKPLSLLFLSFLISAMVTAQSIHFDYIDGTTVAYNLEDLRKITFDADVMNLHMLDGSLYAWNVSTIGNNQYDATPLNVEDWIHTANAMEVVVFPNPTSNFLEVRFTLPAADQIGISLYDFQGKLVLEKHLAKQVSGIYQQTLDLTNVAEGTYLCRIFGKHTYITKKVIKH